MRHAPAVVPRVIGFNFARRVIAVIGFAGASASILISTRIDEPLGDFAIRWDLNGNVSSQRTALLSRS